MQNEEGNLSTQMEPNKSSSHSTVNPCELRSSFVSSTVCFPGETDDYNNAKQSARRQLYNEGVENPIKNKVETTTNHCLRQSCTGSGTTDPLAKDAIDVSYLKLPMIHDTNPPITKSTANGSEFLQSKRCIF